MSKDELESLTAEADLEWIEINKAIVLFYESLGEEFQPLDEELMPIQPSPFGNAIYYRTYSVACLQLLYKTALLILERCHPSMPSNAWVAAGIAARKTGAIANEMGRMSAGLFPPVEASEISPSLGGALIECTFCMLFSGVQYQGTKQRDWLVENLLNVSKMTGWGTANRVVLACEHAWEKAASLGKGPPYTRPDPNVNMRQATITAQLESANAYVFRGSASKAFWAVGVLGPMEGRMEELHLFASENAEQT